MVLKTKDANIAPAFEDEDNVTTAAPAANTPSAVDTSKADATTAIAKASAGVGSILAEMDAAGKFMVAGTAVKPLKATAAFGDFESALPDVDFGTFPRITVDLGGFEMDKEVLGEYIKLEMMSWAHRYVVTPGADDKEASALVKYSNDGVTLSDGSGTSVADYLKTLKDVHGHDNASVKNYIDLTGLLVAKADKDIPEDEQVIVQVQLSPQSVKQFNGYRITKGVMEARKGTQTGNILTLTKERGEFGTNKFAFIKFK